MKKTIALTVVVTLAFVLLVFFSVQYMLDAPWKPRPQAMPTPAPTGDGWINLLDAAHQPHWENITDDADIFGIEDDMLQIYGRTKAKLRYAGYTERTFSDFDLHLEFKVAPRCNSGVFLRVLKNDPVRRGFEIQVLDDHGKAPSFTSSGSIYDVATPMFNMSRPAGEWNSYDISARGHHIVVYMNGWKVMDADFSKMTDTIGKFTIPYAELPLDGFIALQDHGGQVWYRNIFVRPADAAVDAPAQTIEQDAPAESAEVSEPVVGE